MSTTICTEHGNELVLVDDVLDPGGSAVVALGLTNQDGSDTFPGRTLTPDQAEELAPTSPNPPRPRARTTPLRGSGSPACSIK